MIFIRCRVRTGRVEDDEFSVVWPWIGVAEWDLYSDQVGDSASVSALTVGIDYPQGAVHLYRHARAGLCCPQGQIVIERISVKLPVLHESVKIESEQIMSVSKGKLDGCPVPVL